MKRHCYFFLVLALSFAFVGVGRADYAYDAYLVQSSNGTKYFVDVVIKSRGTASDKLGNATFFFNFNPLAVQVASKDPAYDGPWDDNAHPDYYSDVTKHVVNLNPLSRVSLNFVRVEGAPENGGVAVPQSLTRVGRLVFNIVDASKPKNISWNTTFCGIVSWDLNTDLTSRFNFSNAQPVVSWALPVNLVNGSYNAILTVGGDPAGTDGYDPALDIPAPPPGAGSVYAFLSLGNIMPYRLFTDVRGWITPFNAIREWKLSITNAENTSTTLSWDALNLPEQGRFSIFANDTPIYNMRTTTQITVSGNKDLTIRYTYNREVRFRFTQAGYHLISLPVQAEDMRVSTLFPGALNGVALEWDVTTLSYKKVTVLEIGKGYWIAMNAIAEYVVTGTPISTITKNYVPGWHLVGTPLGITDFTNPDDTPNNSVVTPAYGWSSGSNNYITTTSLEETKGYWILVWQNCSLTLTGISTVGKIIPPDVAGDWDEAFHVFGQTPPAPPALNAESELALPTSHEVYANYPNPFNPTTTVSYRLADQEHVVVRVLNVRGELVRTLVDEGQTAGYHTACWDGKNGYGLDAAGGVYFIEFLLGAKHEVIKATLLK